LQQILRNKDEAIRNLEVQNKTMNEGAKFQEEKVREYKLIIQNLEREQEIGKKKGGTGDVQKQLDEAKKNLKKKEQEISNLNKDVSNLKVRIFEELDKYKKESEIMAEEKFKTGQLKIDNTGKLSVGTKPVHKTLEETTGIAQKKEPGMELEVFSPQNADRWSRRYAG